jgi:predicted lipoprotein with Yx(FWY)xxD motif
VVLADAKGKTIYTYTCGDDSVDQLACDQVDSPQVYRLAICGGGQVARCLHDWPYVVAPANAKSLSRTWQVLEINPNTGHLAQPGEPSLRVWAYMGKPVYTYVRDQLAGDISGNADGEFGARRNGFKAFFVRPEFSR